jgi:nicotinate phosphoribosyltransferase
LTITGPLEQAQLLETLVLNIVNHQSLIATKARRLSYAAAGRPIMEFGARRAQGPDSALYGTRAAIIGGANSISLRSCLIFPLLVPWPTVGLKLSQMN